jgi:hypothetical protein
MNDAPLLAILGILLIGGIWLTWHFFHEDKNYLIIVGSTIGVVMLVNLASYYGATGWQTADTEILNSEVIDKKREHGSYVRSYECMCVSSTTGSGSNQRTTRTCQTCYEDRYTVEWTIKSGLGTKTIDSKDWTTKTVYLLPDPTFYTNAKRGDPWAQRHMYVNYIKAVPESLFQSAGKVDGYEAHLKDYPSAIYDFYNLDRLVQVKASVPNAASWNKQIAETAKLIGPAKQANLVIVLVKDLPEQYFYALERHWLKGKKNDVIAVIGYDSLESPAKWVNIMSMSKSEVFNIRLKDDLMGLAKLDPLETTATIRKNVIANYQRKPMADFEYLKDSISPPIWVIAALAILNVISLFGIYFFYVYQNSHRNRRYRY